MSSADKLRVDSSVWRAKGAFWVVGIHSALIVVLTLVAPWVPAKPPYDDIYLPFFCVSGPADFIAMWACDALWPWLSGRLEYHTASWLVIVYLPALICLVVGGAQWYLISVVIIGIKRRLTRLPSEGRCRKCGYDLRATPERCPECGTKA